MRVFLDSNVFIYAAGTDHPLKAPCVSILARAAAGELDATTSAEVLQELVHVYRRRNMVREGIALVREVLRLFPDVLPISGDTLTRSLRLLERYPQLSPRDSLHAATALEHDIGVIVSADADFDAIRELRRVSPPQLPDLSPRSSG